MAIQPLKPVECSLLDNADTPYIVLDPKGCIIYLNNKMAHLLKGSRRDLIGKDWFTSMVDRQEIKKATAAFEEIISSSQTSPRVLAYSLKRASSGEQPIRWTLTAIRDEADEVSSVLQAAHVHFSADDKIFEDQPAGRYKSFFENDISGVYLSSPQGKLLDCNPAFVDMFGYSSKEDILQVDMANLYPHKSNREDFLRRLSEEKKLIGSSVDLQTKNGILIHCIENVIGIFDDNGELVQFQGYITDVTKKIQAEEALRLKDKQFKDFFESATIGMYRTTPDGTILMANQVVVEMLGFKSFEELVQRNLNKEGFMPDSLRADFQQRIERDGMVTGLETAWATKDGLQKFIRESAVAIRDHRGKTLYYEGTVEDISEHKRAEIALAESQRQLSILMSNLPGMAYSCRNDQNWKMEFISQGCAALTGYKAEEIIGNSRIAYADIIHKDDRQMVWDEIQKALKKQERFQLTYRITTLSGEGKWVLEQGQGIFDKNNHLLKLEGFIFDITERKHAESALLESERRLRTVLETVELVAITLNTNGEISFCNNFFLSLTGWTREEIIGKNWFDTCLPSEIRDHLQHKIFAETITGGDFPSHYRNHIITKSNKKRLIAWNNAVFYDNSGRVQGVTSIGEDITERVQAEEALRKNEAQLSKIMLAANDGMWEWDLRSNKVFFDARYYKMAGYAVNEFPHELAEFQNRVHPDDIDTVMNTAQDYLNGATERFVVDFRFKMKTGKWLWVQGRGVIVERDESGLPLRFLGTHTDISDRKRAEQRFRTLFESAPDAYYIHDLRGNFVDGNKASEILIGYKRKELIGKNFIKLGMIPHHQTAKAAANIAKNAVGKPTLLDDFSLRRKDGKVIDVEITSQPIKIDGKTLVLGAARDVTKRKRDQERIKKLSRLNQSLHGADSLEEKLIQVTDSLVDIIGADFARIWLVQKGDLCEQGCIHANPAKDRPACSFRDQCLHLVAGSGRYSHTQNSMHKRVPIGSYKIGQVAAALEPGFLTNDVTNDPRVHDHQWARELGLVSFAGYRLQSHENKPIGVLAVFCKHKLTENEEALLQTIAATTSEAIIRHNSLLALRESEEKYRSLIDQSMDAIYLLFENKFELINRRFTELFGYTLTETQAAGFNFRQLLAPQSLPIIEERLARFKSGKELEPVYEFVALSKTGKEVVCEVSTSYIDYQGGKATQGIIRDITERKQAEKALRESEVKYSTLVENANEAIVVAQDGVLKFCNSKTAEITEYSESELISKPFIQLVYKDDYELVYSRFQKRLRGENIPSSYSFRLRTKSGRIKWLNISSVVISWEGAPATLNFFSDITESKQAEEELRKLTRAVEQSSSSIVITDTLGNIEYVNPHFCRLTGYSESEAVGQNPRILKSDETNPELYVKMWDTITSGKEWRGEFVNRKKNGELFWEIASVSPIKNEAGDITHFLGIKEDITEQKQLEDQLRQSQKMEAIGKLAGGVAHDFNNLLTVINGYTEMLMSPLNRQDPVKKRLQQILGAGKRAAALTNQLLAFSRKQVLKPEILDLNSLISDTEKMLKRLIGENIELATFYELNLAPVEADAGQIEQIIINLAVNAKDAMPDGGNLTIETQNAFLDENFAKHHEGARVGQCVLIAVSDNGIGMDKEVQAHIFEPFFTTKEKGKGTGLGLSTVYGIIKQSGGHVWVYSEKGRGTSFKIYLPAVAKKTSQKEEKPTHEGLYCGSETILLVEDEEDVRLLAEQALTELGYHIISAKDGADGLRTAHSYQNKIDLLLADVIMPNMSGGQLGEKIGEVHPEAKICYMSGYTDDAIVHHGVLEKGVHLIQKPFTLHTLAKKVRSVLDGSS